MRRHAAPSPAINCRFIRATPMSATWSSRPFPDRTRTPSRRAWLPERTPISGTFPTCRSTLPISGRSYDSIIRVNSQSGKGGVAYLLERDYQLVMPRRLQIEFSQVVQSAADITGKELTSQEIWELFSREYLAARAPYVYRAHQLTASTDGADHERLTLHMENAGQPETWLGQGSGPIDAMVNAIASAFRCPVLRGAFPR